MTKTVVVLGGSYGGLGVAHGLLRRSRRDIPDLHVILVSQSTHLYWNIASVRAIAGGLTDEEIALPLAPGFARYPADAFRLVIGSVTAVEAEAGTVTVSTAEEGDQVLTYDALVVATGARCLDETMPWKGLGDHDAVLARLRAARARAADASDIVVGGAGATGVETAAELAYTYLTGTGRADQPQPGERKKTVTLLSSGPEILSGDSIAGAARKELESLGVVVRNGAAIEDSAVLPDGRTEIRLKDGSTVTADAYLPTMGLQPNSEFIRDRSLLTERGYLAVDDTFQTTGARAGDRAVFGVGDVVSRPRAGFLITDWHSPQVARNVELFLRGERPRPVSNMPTEIFMTATGPKRGAGRIGFVRVPSFIVYTAKGRTLGLERLSRYVDGSRWY